MSVRAMTWVWEQPGLSPVERLVLLAYADCADDEGKCWPHPKTVAAKTGLGRATVYRARTRLQELGLAVSERNITRLSLRHAVSQGDKLSHSDPATEPSITTNEPPSSFVQFWEAFPRRQGKRKAGQAYTAALRRGSASEILVAVQRYRDDPNREPEFTTLPATWLNQDRWLDEPLPPRKRSQHPIDRAMRAAFAEGVNGEEQPSPGFGRPALRSVSSATDQ